MENPIKLDDLGVPPFSETSRSGFPAFPTWIEVVSIEVEPEHAVVSQCPGVPRNGTAFGGHSILCILCAYVFFGAVSFPCGT